MLSRQGGAKAPPISIIISLKGAFVKRWAERKDYKILSEPGNYLYKEAIK